MADSGDTAYLRGHGVMATPAQIDRAVAAAIESQTSRLRGDPADELSVAEMEALTAGSFDLTPRVKGRMGPLERTIAAYAALIRTSLTTAQTAERLGVDQSRVRQRLKERSLYGFHIDGEWLLPPVQFSGRRSLPDLAVVLAALDPSVHPLSFVEFLWRPHPDLRVSGSGRPVSPRDWLLAGHDAGAVAALAAEL